jgi:hypothetical protein
MLSIKLHDIEIEARVPTVAELTKVRREQSHEGLKALAKACVVSPKWSELMKQLPGAGFSIGRVIFEASGGKAEAYVLDEDELTDDLAKAMVEAEKKGFAGLKAIVIGHKDLELNFIVRAAKEREIDAFAKDVLAVENHKALAAACTVYPEKLDLDRTAPGIYLGLGGFIADQAGFVDDALAGE